MLKIEITLWKSSIENESWVCKCDALNVRKTGSTPRVAFMNVINALKRIKKEQLEGLLRTRVD